MKTARHWVAGRWDNRKDPSTGEWVRTFAVLTTVSERTVAMTRRSVRAAQAQEDGADEMIVATRGHLL